MIQEIKTDFIATNMVWISESEIICCDEVFDCFYINTSGKTAIIRQVPEIMDGGNFGVLLHFPEEASIVSVDTIGNKGISFYKTDDILSQTKNGLSTLEQNHEWRFESDCALAFANNGWRDIQINSNRNLVSIMGHQELYIFDLLTGDLKCLVNDRTLSASSTCKGINDNATEYIQSAWLDEKLLAILKTDPSFYFQAQILVVDVSTCTCVGELPLVSPPVYFSTVLADDNLIVLSKERGVILVNKTDFTVAHEIGLSNNQVVDMFLSCDHQNIIVISRMADTRYGWERDKPEPCYEDTNSNLAFEASIINLVEKKLVDSQTIKKGERFFANPYASKFAFWVESESETGTKSGKLTIWSY